MEKGYRRGPCGREQLRRRKEDADQRLREDVLGGREGEARGPQESLGVLVRPAGFFSQRKHLLLK